MYYIKPWKKKSSRSLPGQREKESTRWWYQVITQRGPTLLTKDSLFTLVKAVWVQFSPCWGCQGADSIELDAQYVCHILAGREVSKCVSVLCADGLVSKFQDTGLRMMSSGNAPMEADPRPGSGEGRMPLHWPVSCCYNKIHATGKQDRKVDLAPFFHRKPEVCMSPGLTVEE